MLAQQLHRHHAAQRITDDVGFLDLEVIEESENIVNDPQAVCLVVLRLVGAAVSGISTRDHFVIRASSAITPVNR